MAEINNGELASQIVQLKVEAVSKILSKYTDPKPEYTDMFANTIALEIIAELIQIDNLTNLNES